jgi:hypothetical protein
MSTTLEINNPFEGLSPLEKYNRKQKMFQAWGRGMKMLNTILEEPAMVEKREVLWSSCELCETKVEQEPTGRYY